MWGRRCLCAVVLVHCPRSPPPPLGHFAKVYLEPAEDQVSLSPCFPTAGLRGGAAREVPALGQEVPAEGREPASLSTCHVHTV